MASQNQGIIVENFTALIIRRNTYKTWHAVNFAETHWPISKEQFWYDSETFWNPLTWIQQVNQSSIGRTGVYGGLDWNDNYKIVTDGRRYR